DSSQPSCAATVDLTSAPSGTAGSFWNCACLQYVCPAGIEHTARLVLKPPPRTSRGSASIWNASRLTGLPSRSSGVSSAAHATSLGGSPPAICRSFRLLVPKSTASGGLDWLISPAGCSEVRRVRKSKAIHGLRPAPGHGVVQGDTRATRPAGATI